MRELTASTAYVLDVSDFIYGAEGGSLVSLRGIYSAVPVDFSIFCAFCNANKGGMSKSQGSGSTKGLDLDGRDA